MTFKHLLQYERLMSSQEGKRCLPASLLHLNVSSLHIPSTFNTI